MKKTFEFGGTSWYGFAGEQSITIDENMLTIHKGGVVNSISMSNGDKTFDIGQITAVQVKKHGFMPGYLQISSIGNTDFHQGNFNALSSENAVVIYNDNQYQGALEIKKYVEENRARFKNSGQTTVVNVKSAAEQIKEYKELLDMGIISQEEFDAKKKELMGL